MAQAARLSLRMQKELKLLLSDPPPGATFPYISSTDSTSISTIDAQIEGPKGTVYENGCFHIKIQIPDRYPFQPPVVTFATPVYHPNIDTGGRICLDILNLPPKGAWQPSLNISTIITSIGLLLSEPNPDDGLMCEASKEYKYNRLAFDQKARSMTEKYAKALNGGSGSSNEGFLINSDSSQGTKGKQNKVESEESNLKLHSMSRKLSLQPAGSSENSNDKRVAEQANIAPSDSQMKHTLESNHISCNSIRNEGKLSGMRRKLSLEGLCQSRKKSNDETNKMSDGVGGCGLAFQDVGMGLGPKHPVCQKFPADYSDKAEHDKSNEIEQVIQPASTISSPKVPKISSSNSLDVDCGEVKPPIEGKKLAEYSTTIPQPYNKHRLSNKKLNLGNRKLDKGIVEDNKENIPRVALHQPTPEPTYQTSKLHLLSSSVFGKQVDGTNVNTKSNSSNRKQGVSGRLSLQPLKSLQACHDSDNEVNVPDKGIGQQVRKEPEPPISSEAIVLDSEDEEDKDEPVCSKVIVARKRLCLAGKRKVK